MKRILNIDDAHFEHHAHGEKFEARDAPMSEKLGGKNLGVSFIVVPPGKRAYPMHCHHVNEEAFFVVEGRGVVRIGEEEFPIRKGDVIVTPAGGRDAAHQIVNTSREDLRYLAISTMLPGEVVEYTDSGKVAVYVGSAPGADPAARTFTFRGRLGKKQEYWDDE